MAAKKPQNQDWYAHKLLSDRVTGEYTRVGEPVDLSERSDEEIEALVAVGAVANRPPSTVESAPISPPKPEGEQTEEDEVNQDD